MLDISAQPRAISRGAVARALRGMRGGSRRAVQINTLNTYEQLRIRRMPREERAPCASAHRDVQNNTAVIFAAPRACAFYAMPA